VLIANRGEIAVRILRTLKSLEIPSVVVYHPVDADSLAVREADEAVEIFGDTPVGAYLSPDNIIAACHESGADAVHPGFGFLSENAGFARRLEAEGITFIGPRPEAIEAMGDKITSKRLAEEAGVNVIPGLVGELEDADQAMQLARDMGYPVMLKASAGGGGKGMRIARDDTECRDGFARATREAAASFGDGRVFLEKYIETPRHIEIQILADSHGNTVYLGERECSIQRRHQKVIEEAPSPFIDPETRAAMGEQAVALAQAVGYISAGTVELIVDTERNFYFLEMNTRLQVEHPVTELITGLDIVAEQIRIARGETLGYGQEDVRLNGHAIECRLYAEDADNGFLPATGPLLLFRPPQGPGLRLDNGVVEGQAVTASFDPMLAKLVAFGSDRAQAIARARAALKDTVILGVTTNAAFLERVLAHPAFVVGDTHTGFLDAHAEDLKRPLPSPEALATVLSAAALSSRHFTDTRHKAPAPLASMGAWRN
jgi:propionyl-CoA carboxylase alpha chain